MRVNNKHWIINLLVIIYFINALLEILAESISSKPIIYITKPLIPFFFNGFIFY